MVTKNSVNKLVKGGRWTGRRLGKSIILSVIEELHGNEQLISNDEIHKILSKATDDDRNVYNKYVNIFNGVVDLFNFVSACDYQGRSGAQTLLTYLKGIMQSFEIEQNKNHMPLLVTERQYKRYKEKYNDLLKEKAQEFKALPVTLFDTIFVNDTDTKNKAIRAVWDKYKNENVDPKYFDLIKQAFKDMYDEGTPFFHYDTLATAFMDPKDVETYYKQTIAEQYPVASGDVEEAIINAQMPKVVDPFPTNITKYDLINDFEVFKPLTYADITPDFEKAMYAMLTDQYSVLIKTTVEELSTASPKIKKNLATKKLDITEPFATYGEMATAGVKFYKKALTTTDLKKAYAFDNAVPEKHKMQVAKYGIAEIHPTGMLSRINNADDEEYQSNQIEIINTASSIENLANDKGAIQTIKNSYTEINVCLAIMQAYDAFVDGLALAGDEVRFKGLKEHMLSQDTKEKIDMVNSLIAMIYTDFEDYEISKSITKKYQKLFKELFPPIDVNKKRTAMTTQEVADYIDHVFDNSNNDVFSATRTLLAIRGGASID